MKQVSAVDLYFLVKELRDLVLNSRVETFYQEEDIFYIKIYSKGKGHFFLTNKISKYLVLTDKKNDKSSFPSSFIQYLRKYLKNGFISGFEQFENERIIKIQIDKKKIDSDEIEVYYLFIELFANGNVIVTDKDWIIKNSIIKKKFKDRKVIVKEKYELPPQREISIFNLDEELFVKYLKESDLSIVKFLAIKLGIGGKFAEEIVFNSKINKDKLSIDLNNEEIKIIIKNINDIVNKEIKPLALMDSEGKIKDFFPFKFNSINGEFKEYDSFNSLLVEYFNEFRINIDKKEEEFKQLINRLEIRIKKQERIKEQILRDVEKFSEIGNKIYENYAFIDDLLKTINQVSKERGWDYVKKVIEDNEVLKSKVKKLNPNNNEIVLNL